jgi:uncharacterized protein
MLKDIVAATALGEHRLHLRFEDGVEGVVDLAPHLSFQGVFEPLRDPASFARVRADPELGTVAWPKGTDLDPDVLYGRITGTPIYPERDGYLAHQPGENASVARCCSTRCTTGTRKRAGSDARGMSHNRDMITLDALRAERREEILRLAGRRGAHSLRVFGSVARGEADENSDLDLLVAWEPGRSLMDHAGLVEDLQELLGMKVHVGTERSLHWYVRDRILREATAL